MLVSLVEKRLFVSVRFGVAMVLAFVIAKTVRCWSTVESVFVPSMVSAVTETAFVRMALAGSVCAATTVNTAVSEPPAIMVRLV